MLPYFALVVNWQKYSPCPYIHMSRIMSTLSYISVLPTNIFFADRSYHSTGKFIRLLNIINEIKLARSFNFTSRYVDDVLSLTISTFGDFVDCIYPIVPNLQDVSRLVVILAHTTCM